MRYLFVLFLMAAAPPPGSDDALALQGHEDWVNKQVSPGGFSCCSISDGRPALIRGTPGHYQVFFDKQHWPDGNNIWLDVPNEVILPNPSPILDPIAWIYHGKVLCLALPAAA